MRPTDAPASIEGTALPELAARDIATRASVTVANERGRVVLLDFWASWCAPCKVSMPYYTELARRHQERGLSVIGISVDDTFELADRFVRETQPGFPLWWDEGQRAAERLSLRTMPTAFLIDRNGVVRHVHYGFVDDDRARIEALVEQLLAEPASPPT